MTDLLSAVRIPFEPLSPFGALVDIDASRDVNEAVAGDLLQLFRVHYLLLLRDQDLDTDGHRRVLEWLGPVPPDDGLVSNDPAVGLQGSGRLAFHSDLAFAAEPDLAVSLYALDLVAGTSTTSFANGALAYR
jgi:alpha-ketoglutarate-dependent taurine dioxygenase